MTKRGLPVYKGIVFRGVDLDFPKELLVEGGTFLDHAFLSSSFLSQTSFSDKEGDTLFIIKSKTGMLVKKFPIMMKKTRFYSDQEHCFGSHPFKIA
jgi:hypothetical protein